MPAHPVVMLWGESAFLLREAAHRALGDDPFGEVDGEAWHGGLLADLATPSLFGERRGLLVAEAQDLKADSVDAIAAYALEPNPDARLVLAVTVSARAKGPPARMSKMLQGRAHIERVGVERKELPRWVIARAKERGIPSTPAGATALIETVGEDPALLAQSVAQIANAFPREGVTPETVGAQFRGLGDRRIWELCDAAFGRQGPAAVRHLRAMLDAREQPLAILGGVAARLRELLRVAGVPPGMKPAEAARAAGLRFDWQVRRYREQVARFGEGELVDLLTRVVEADAQIKLGGAPEVVLAKLVARIAGEPALRG
ncbi:MAG TPA: DNA polymerase III subunit delta [Actinomycetota bacterium]